MDLTLSAEEVEFQAEARRWLRANSPNDLPSMLTPEGLAQSRAWERKLFEAGYAALNWPAEYGGADASLMLQSLFQEEYIDAAAPTRLNRLGLGLIGPTLIAKGSPEQKQRFLPRILACEDIWCQGFSEPGAGSDLAAVRTTALVDGDELVINGQKTWTSLAVIANWMFAVVRTSPRGAKKHHGLSFVLIPLETPGVDIRPLRQLHGEPGFGEVFLDDVRIPMSNVVGEVGEGWSVTLLALNFERGTGLGNHARYQRDIRDLAVLARANGRSEDADVRRRLAMLTAEASGFRSYMRNVLSRMEEGDTSVVPSVTKLTWSLLDAKIFALAVDLLGELAQVADGAADHTLNVHSRYWHARASAIFAGATEVQRNIIAERTLGLPR